MEEKDKQKEELTKIIQSVDDPAFILFVLTFVKRLKENWRI